MGATPRELQVISTYVMPRRLGHYGDISLTPHFDPAQH